MSRMARPADKATALWVVKKLRHCGHQALFAGGCVRDMLLSRRCADYDVATDATPQQVKQMFRRVLMVGAKFGVAMVIKGDRMVEVATFRSDLSYSDGRRPDGVEFTSPKQDALRRDFTINGMFFDPIDERVIDHVSGRADLARKVVRTIGQPEQRFAEDYLRMMRAVRFAVRLGFRIDPATARAIEQFGPNIASISGERVYDELQKMFSCGGAAAGAELLGRLHLAEHILPELFADAQAKLWDAATARLGAIDSKPDPVLSFGALLMDLPSPVIANIIRRWGQSNDLRKTLQWFTVHRDGWADAAELRLCEFKKILANANYQKLKTLWSIRELQATGQRKQARRIARRASGIDPRKIAPKPFVTGDRLLKMGYQPGRKIGLVLRKLYDDQLDETLKTKQAALNRARELLP